MNTTAQPTAPTAPPPLAFTRRDAALLILLAFLVALYFWRILTPNSADRAQFPVGDFTDQFYAFRLYEARALAQGRIPLWSENFNSGHPFLADIQSAVFYPIALLNTLTNLALFHSFSLFALELEALFHFYLAGVFTYLFARRVLARTFNAPARVGAFTAALVFTFGGYLTSYPSLQLAILETAIWLPLALYFMDRAFPPPSINCHSPLPLGEGLGERSDLRFIIAAALTLGIAALAGHPQTFLFVLSVTVIYFLSRKFHQINSKSKIKNQKSKILLQLVLLALIAFGIAAIQLIPAIEYQQLSTREALSFADAAKGFPTLDILQFILPGYASAFASPLYIGILPLWFALFALLKRRDQTIFWGLLALAALILSFGFYVFAYIIFYLFIPGASLFRQQERLAFVISFALSMLAGSGIQDLITTSNWKHARDVIVAQRLFPLLPMGAALMLALTLTFFVAGTQNPAGRLAFLGDRAGLMLILFGVTSLGLGLYLRKIISLKYFIPLALVLILFDLWSVSESSNKGQVVERFPENSLIAAVKQQPGLFRVTADENLMPGHYGIAYQLQDTSGISPLRLANYDALLKLPEPLRSQLLNVQFQFTQNPPTTNQKTFFQENDQRVNQYLTPQPRAWFVTQPIVQPDNAAAEKTLSDPAFDPTTQAVLSAPPPFMPVPDSQNNKATITSYTPESITIQLNTPAEGLLILSENYYPGWRATLDGQPVEILRANLTLRAIPIRAGSQQLQLTYDPASFKLGSILTMLTALTSIAALLFLQFKKRA